MSQEPSIGSAGGRRQEVSIVSHKGLENEDDARSKDAASTASSSSRASRRSSRRSRIPKLPMFLPCPPNPPYTNYMDEEPSLKFYRKKKVSLKEKYDYSAILKSGHIKCLTNLRYKTMEELEAEKLGIVKKKKKPEEEEEECHETKFITIPASRYPPKQSAESLQAQEGSTLGEADSASKSAISWDGDEASQTQLRPPTPGGDLGQGQESSSCEETCNDSRSADQNCEETNQLTGGADFTSCSCSHSAASKSQTDSCTNQSQECDAGSANQSQQCDSGCGSQNQCDTGSANQNAATEFVCCMCQQRFLCSKLEDGQQCS